MQTEGVVADRGWSVKKSEGCKKPRKGKKLGYLREREREMLGER